MGYIINKIKHKIVYELSKHDLKLKPHSYVDPQNFTLNGKKNLIIGDYVYIGPNALIYCKLSKVTIQDKVTIGPGLTIVAGDHNFSIVGEYISDVHDDRKRPEDDQDIVIESDCWLGANVTVLKGVTIGRGSIVAACACVTKSCPPYSIIGGVPAKVIGMRFTEEQIMDHERILYGK